MRLEFHLQVTSDISRIMDYYKAVAGQHLTEEFYSDLKASSQKNRSFLLKAITFENAM